jgi:hypothetical protein
LGLSANGLQPFAQDPTPWIRAAETRKLFFFFSL